jgi:prephenate dehydrogenase
MSSPIFQNILIYGLGLMGASLALTIKKQFPKTKIHAIVRSQESKLKIESMQIVHSVFIESEFLAQENPEKFWGEYDLIVFGTPVHLIKKQLTHIPKNISAVITDMGSTKKTIIDAVASYYDGQSQHNYISSHPMCGSELAGAENAIDGLYQDKLCILTPLENSNKDALNRLRSFWEAMGMRTHVLDEVSHDRILAYLSHSPHILSSLMVTWADIHVGDENKKSPQPIMGGGFRDMARIAGSNPEMWQAILSENRLSILDSLKEFGSLLEKTIHSLESGTTEEWEKLFLDAAQHKKHLIES